VRSCGACPAEYQLPSQARSVMLACLMLSRQKPAGRRDAPMAPRSPQKAAIRGAARRGAGDWPQPLPTCGPASAVRTSARSARRGDGTTRRIGTHFVDTGGASDHVFALCTMLGIRFCPRLRAFADRRLATLAVPKEAMAAFREMAGRVGAEAGAAQARVMGSRSKVRKLPRRSRRCDPGRGEGGSARAPAYRCTPLTTGGKICQLATAELHRQATAAG
jgi:hypothetical protein